MCPEMRDFVIRINVTHGKSSSCGIDCIKKGPELMPIPSRCCLGRAITRPSFSECGDAFVATCARRVGGPQQGDGTAAGVSCRLSSRVRLKGWLLRAGGKLLEADLSGYLLVLWWELLDCFRHGAKLWAHTSGRRGNLVV